MSSRAIRSFRTGLALLLPAAVNITTYQVSEPAAMVELDMGALKGSPIQLSWSDDGLQLCLQTADGEGASHQHYYVLQADAPRPQRMDVQPVWALQYWAWKSTRNAPGDPTVLIAVDVAEKTGQSPGQSGNQRAGGLSNGDMAFAAAAAAANPVNRATAITLTLKGEVVGEFKDAVVPGLMFGWSPPREHGFAYVTSGGRLALLDLNGGKQEVIGTKNVLLPAWSRDGSQIVYLERTARKRYTLERVAIALK